MFADAFIKVEHGSAAEILDQVNPLLDGSPFDTYLTNIVRHPVDIYDGWSLVEVSHYGTNPPQKVSFLYKKGETQRPIIILDGTDKSILEINKITKLKLKKDEITFYLKFYFEYVMGQYGRLKIIETIDSIDWLEELSLSAKKNLGKIVLPIEIKGLAHTGEYQVTANTVFKNALFRTDFLVSIQGEIIVQDRELLIDDLPIIDDIFYQ